MFYIYGRFRGTDIAWTLIMESEGSPRNVGAHIPDYRASHSRRKSLSLSPPWRHRMSIWGPSVSNFLHPSLLVSLLDAKLSFTNPYIWTIKTDIQDSNLTSTKIWLRPWLMNRSSDEWFSSIWKENTKKNVKTEKTNKMQQSNVYYQLLPQHVSGTIIPIFRRTKIVLLHMEYYSGSAGCGW